MHPVMVGISNDDICLFKYGEFNAVIWTVETITMENLYKLIELLFFVKFKPILVITHLTVVLFLFIIEIINCKIEIRYIM